MVVHVGVFAVILNQCVKAGIADSQNWTVVKVAIKLDAVGVAIATAEARFCRNRKVAVLD